jgi:hypothetical protein
MNSTRWPANLRHIFLSASVSVWLAGCGGGGSGGSTGTLTVGITDAPVDNAEQVIVEVTSLELHSEGGDQLTYSFQPAKSIDLLSLQGGLREKLLDGEQLPAGSYTWMRLGVHADFDGVMDSYIETGGAMTELRIPSGAETGLKINTPFNIVATQLNDLTIDFDLRKSIHQPAGQPGYILRPTLRLVRTSSAGNIVGTVDPTLLAAPGCSTGTNGDAVYVFAGPGTTPDDIDGKDPEPVTTATVAPDATGTYMYRAAYLEPGQYTIALTCQADLDEPDQDDPVVFEPTATVTVTAGTDSAHDF